MTHDASIDRHAQTGRISLIVALGENTRAIGKGGDLLWHIPEDMKRFKALTLGHPVIMGRKTWESLPEKFRPLPGRTNIVVTHQAAYKAPNALVSDSLAGALARATGAEGADEIFVIGGGELYAATLPLATRLYLTLVDDEMGGDTFFPSYEHDFKTVLERTENANSTPAYTWLTLER